MKPEKIIFYPLRNYILAAFFFIGLDCDSQSTSAVLFDRQQSQNFGAYNLTTLHKVLYSFQDDHIRYTLFRENNFWKKSAGFAYRMARLYFLDAQIDGLIALTQHEVFGHGARYRELGYEGNSYNLNLYPPFGDGSGFAKRGTLRDGYTYPTNQENLTATIGGVDGEMLMAGTLGAQILLDDTLHYRQALLYLISQNNLMLYLWYTRLAPDQIKPGNDMVNYMNALNYLYRQNPGRYYEINKLSGESLISLLNPLQFYSAFSILYCYGIKGEKRMRKIPMIKFGNVRYLPALNYSLSPFGSQFHFQNYFRYNDKLISADFLMGESTHNSFYGVSLKGYNIINKTRLSLNIHADVWNQPELELENNFLPLHENKTGGALKVDLMIRPFTGIHKAGLFLQTGYKSKGYLSGEMLDEGLILRGGLSIKL